MNIDSRIKKKLLLHRMD